MNSTDILLANFIAVQSTLLLAPVWEVDALNAVSSVNSRAVGFNGIDIAILT